MSTNNKRKRKTQELQAQEQEPQLDYITDPRVDRILKEGKDQLKHEITKSDIKLTKTKKEIVKETALKLEAAGYPINQICDKIAKSWKGLVHERTVREALDAKYKDADQSSVAKLQDHAGGNLYRQQELSKKDVKEIATKEEIKLLDKTKARQVALYQIQRADWFAQQAKQSEERAKEYQQYLARLMSEILDTRYSDEEIGKELRKAAKDWQKRIKQ